jgi:hypothetical protein
MNSKHEAITYPLVTLSSLSDDAQLMHGQGRSQSLRLDPFDRTRRNRYVSPEESQAFVPTERMLAAIAELEDARLATYSAKFKMLYATRVHDQFSFAHGRGSQFIRVSIFDTDPDEALLLAVLIGGDLESRNANSDFSEISIRARHENATDSEHDASSTASLIVRNVSQPRFSGYGSVKFTGVLTETRMYPIGVDPLSAEDDDIQPGEICTSCDKPHPFIPYLPPAVNTASLTGPRFVTIAALPLRAYHVAALPLFDNAVVAI